MQLTVWRSATTCVSDRTGALHGTLQRYKQPCIAPSNSATRLQTRVLTATQRGAAKQRYVKPAGHSYLVLCKLRCPADTASSHQLPQQAPQTVPTQIFGGLLSRLYCIPFIIQSATNAVINKYQKWAVTVVQSLLAHRNCSNSAGSKCHGACTMARVRVALLDLTWCMLADRKLPFPCSKDGTTSAHNPVHS